MKQFETFELTFEGEKLTKNWAQVDLKATFTDVKGSKTVKGFYAGDGIYKVRYYPTELGNISWKVEGVVSSQGSEECVASNSKGKIKAVGTHLEYDNGDIFYSVGTTVYGLAHQSKELTEETFKTLSENPFNKVRMCLFPKHYDYNINDPEFFPFEIAEGQTYVYERGELFNKKPFLEEKQKIWDVSRPCFDFWDSFEKKIDRLASLGIQVDLILFHPYDRWGFNYLGPERNKIYLDYLLRRFSALPNVWWSLANEYDMCSNISPEEWKSIEKFIGENDPYHHLMSNHNCITAYDFSGEYITHCSLQKRTMSLVPEYMERYNKPVLYDECVYEGNLKQTWGALSGQEMMNRFWKVTTQGGYCTHGEVFLDMDMEDIDNAVLWWAKGGKLIGTSPKRIAYLKSIMDEINRPLVPYEGNGFAKLFEGAAKMSPSELENAVPHPFLRMNEYRKNASEIELNRHKDAEINYAGHYEDEVFLFYYGTDCCARVDITLPENHTYKVEVIDAWNMTRKTFATGVSGTLEVKLSGHEYMAVLATIEK